MKTKLLIILSILIATNSYGYEVTSKEEKSFKIKPGAYITVIGDEGYIRVDSWDKDEVHLVIIKRAWARSKREAKERLKKIEVEIEDTNNRLNIREVNSFENNNFSMWDIFDPDRWGHKGSATVDFELKVPREVDLKLETDEGDIRVADIMGDLELDIDEGELRIKNIEFKNITIAIDEGDVDCNNIFSDNGYVNIDSDEGEVRIKNGEMKKLKIDCDEGDITLRDVRANSGHLETDEGDIEANIDIQENGRYRIYTDEGDVIIYLPRKTDLTINLETEDGRIESDFDIDITELEDGERARCKIGNGGAKLEVYTDEGDISLERK